MEVLYLLLLFAVTAAFVSYPFWGRGGETVIEDPAVAAIEAARDAKYREIRDAEVDLATGKLSQEDYDRVNAELRADAVELLKKLDQVRGAGNG